MRRNWLKKRAINYALNLSAYIICVLIVSVSSGTPIANWQTLALTGVALVALIELSDLFSRVIKNRRRGDEQN